MRWLARFFAFTPPPLHEPEAPPERAEFPCGVLDCYETQIVVRLDSDGKYIVVECPVHATYTHWETKKREPKEQQIIRVQDGWRQHGTRERPK